MKTSNIFNINVGLIAGHVLFWFGDSAISVTQLGHPDIVTEDTMKLQIQTATWCISY